VDDQRQEAERSDDDTANVAAEAQQPEEQPEAPELEAEAEAVEAEGKPEPEEHRTVPYQALKEERAKRQDRDRELEKLNSRIEALVNHLNQPAPQPEKPAADEDPEPSPEEDAYGHITWQMRQIRKEQAKLAEGYQSQQTDAQRRAQLQQINRVASESVKRFSADVPDYADAYQHYRQQRGAQFQLQGYNAQQAQQALNNEELQMIVKAGNLGRDPAELVYEWAKTYGYQPRQAEATAGDDQPAKLPKPAPKSVSGMAGKPVAKKATATDIAKMSDQDFAAYMSKLTPAEKKAVLGG
jgi:hypothetical protein